VFLLEHEGRFALRRRPEKGLLAGLWEFPNEAGWLNEMEAFAWAEARGLAPESVRSAGSAVHVFSHLEWHMIGCRIRCGKAPAGFVWAENDALHALPTAFRAYKDQIWG